VYTWIHPTTEHTGQTIILIRPQHRYVPLPYSFPWFLFGIYLVNMVKPLLYTLPVPHAISVTIVQPHHPLILSQCNYAVSFTLYTFILLIL
jgi:hypothetical protein